MDICKELISLTFLVIQSWNQKYGRVKSLIYIYIYMCIHLISAIDNRDEWNKES